MSGQQIGSFVGGVIGAYFGGPFGYAIGSAIGGAIGGYIDPTIIKGPRLTDATQQTASDGVPLVWGGGTFPTAGNIIWTSKLREKTKEDDGKGSGMVNVTFHYYRDFAIAICQALRQDDGTYLPIAGILQVKRNGKIVYDVTPGASNKQLASNTKFLRSHKFYLGSENQEPDATIESHKGVGNTPAYPGTVYMVVTNFEVTESGGAIPQYEFVVATTGNVSDVVETTFRPDRTGAFTNSHFPLAGPQSDYEFEGQRTLQDGSAAIATGATIAEVLAAIGDCGYPGGVPGTYIGYSDTVPWDDPEEWVASNAGEMRSVIGAYQVALYYNVSEGSGVLESGADYCAVIPSGVDALNGPIDHCGRLLGNYTIPEPGNLHAIDICGGSTRICAIEPIRIMAVAKVGLEPNDPGIQIPDAPGFYLDADGEVQRGGEKETISGTFKWLAATPNEIDDDGQLIYGNNAIDPVLRDDDPNYNSEAFWTNAYLASDLPDGWTYGVDYPVSKTFAWRPLPLDNQAIQRLPVTVGTLVAEACKRSNLVSDDFDVSQLTDVLDGFKVAVESSGEAIIAPLTQTYFFDSGEWDDKLRFVKRGGDVVAELTADDLCETDGDVIQETELQEVELLRKVNIRAIDPDAGFAITTQTAERRTSTIAARGEQTTEVPVVIDGDTQAQIADKKLKVAWSETRKFSTTIPYTHPELTVTDVVGLTDGKGRRQRIRLMEIAEDSGRIELKEAMLDRQSSYSSNVEGVVHASPEPPEGSISGPTYFVPMNLPSLRTQDNVAGAYIGACGYMPGWRGAVILMSVDGGQTYQRVATFTEPSSMGVLKAECTESSEPILVFMNSGTLSSITAQQIALRMNAFAITTNGVSELGQFQTADQHSSGIYELTDLIRGGLNTTPAAHEKDDAFVMVATAQFLPIDISLAGRTLLFKAVTNYTSADDAQPVPFLFNPIFTNVTVEAYTDENDEAYTDENGEIYYTETSL